MSVTAVLGCLWGDEGKAKIVDALAVKADAIIRFQGGSNAGHTIIKDGEKFVFHLVPSGMLYPEKNCFLGAGTVIDPIMLLQEMDELRSRGLSFEGRFFIDPRATLVLPLHKELDSSREDSVGQTKIGTTRRGIGPTYADRASRIAPQIIDLTNPVQLRARLERIYAFHKKDTQDIDNVITELLAAGERLKPYFAQVPYLLDRFHSEGRELLFEGAQGTLLDVGFGTYPFVTSSYTSAGGISAGSGFAPNKIDRILGVYKAYTTRVGEGPFPTELNNETGNRIREQGHEYGASTGRPRRCGWFDAVAARFTAMINGLTDGAITLLDVLSGFDKIKICIGYCIEGISTREMPFNAEDLEHAEPIYIEMDGWREDISTIREYDQLPENTKKYIAKLEEVIGIRFTVISVGPDRKQTIYRT